ncbi:hypothetical protein Dimus_018420, partial [Dionaea muscipula]
MQGHFQQAVKSILNGMEEQNNGIKELFELLDSKTFTDNQKEKITWAKMDEVKAYLENITKKINGLLVALKKTIRDVGDIILDKLKDLTSTVKTHCELMEVNAENNKLELRHLMEAGFLKQDSKLADIEKIVK